LYGGFVHNPFTNTVKVVADLTGFEHEYVRLANEDKEEFKKNKYFAGTLPYLEDTATGEGFGESVAIARFMCNSKPEAGLYGSSAYETSKIDEVIDGFMSNLNNHGVKILYATLGFAKLDDETFKTQSKNWKDYLRLLNDRLEGKEYLVGDKLSLADVYVAVSLNLFFATSLDAGFRKAIPHLTKWYESVRNNEVIVKHLGKPRFAGKGIKPQIAK
jgi:glutathione S-transferase